MTRGVCELITIGNELLIGKIVNTNAHWLAKRITSLGGKVKRIIVVGDYVDEIALSIQEALTRKNDFIITVGGLGPTFDDKTLEGIAKALKTECEIHDQALKMVDRRHRQYIEDGRIVEGGLTKYRLKVAKLPKGSEPINNSIGTSPGMMAEYDGTKIIALPGVPAEMKGIFEESIAPLCKKAAGNVMFFETALFVERIMESEIAPLVEKVMHDNPYVYIKSHPKGTEKVSQIELHFSTATEKKRGRDLISKALVQISELIRDKGGKIKPVRF
jgi:molybdenum cofactor synthesis domain-containing protein